MNKIDQRINKIIKGKKDFNSFNFKNVLKNKNNISFSNLMKNSFKTKNVFKGASLKMQKRWSDFPNFKKQYLRKILIDTDKDLTPNRYDCQPFNKRKQDDNFLDSVKKKIESLGYPVTKITPGKNKNFTMTADIPYSTYIGKALIKGGQANQFDDKDIMSEYYLFIKGLTNGVKLIISPKEIDTDENMHDHWFLINNKEFYTSIDVLEDPYIDLAYYADDEYDDY